jgi:hypothetical protein
MAYSCVQRGNEGNSLVALCLVEVEIVILKYRSLLHFLKSSVRRRVLNDLGLYMEPIGHAKTHPIELQFCLFSPAIVSPVRPLACIGNWTSKSPKPSSLQSYTAFRMIAPQFHDSLSCESNVKSSSLSSSRSWHLEQNIPPPLIDNLDLAPLSPASSPSTSSPLITNYIYKRKIYSS